MDSLDAQCLMIDLLAGEIRPPDHWRHDSSGALSCRYEDGTRAFTWPPKDVAAMARRWRESDTSAASEQAIILRDAHERLVELAGQAGLGDPDVVIHDIPGGELRALWNDRKLAVVIDELWDGGEDAPAAG
ncbi:MAG TPA: hypothetical protein VGF25_11065 [Thermoleophilaceae bacterium]|jgi:hypothetical protein